uniref:protein-tyrosine-phosphatase n=1 Tax=Panagrellus redivivus TaxID=6233 RepID=A0A7E4W543_PANRE
MSSQEKEKHSGESTAPEISGRESKLSDERHHHGASSATGTTTTDADTYTGRTAQFTSPASFPLKPGQFLHDVRDRERSLVSFANNLRAMSVFDVFFDYTRVISQDAKQSAYEFSRAENDAVNRYRDIRCVDATRVNVPGADGKNYIHANYVDGFREVHKFILTQAPLSTSVQRFWDMIWQEKSTLIISLTVLDGERTALYIPTKSGESIAFGEIKIVNMGTRHIRDSYDATVLMVAKGDSQARKLLHIAFYAWPDKGTPTRPTEVLYMLDDANHNRKLLVDEAVKKGWLPAGQVSPIVVHCLAGVGRSGALAALDICIAKLDHTHGRDNGPCLDVRDTVLRIRTQREMAVQKPEQYLFLHLATLEYAIRRRYFDSIDCVDLSKFMLKKEDK